MKSLSCQSVLAGLIVVSAASLLSAQFAPSLPGSPYGPLPAPQVVPNLPPPAVALPPAIVPVRPITVSEFAASFKPLPGRYEVLLIHPKTCCPVKVCFTLPPGCIRKVAVNGHKVAFVYKCQHDVVIRFLHNGNVWVRGC